MFEAVPKSEALQARRFRGFIALDDVKFQPGEQCRGHCTFDSGLCGFTNDASSNFDWSVGRGSANPNTGPQRDHSSFTTNRVTGATYKNYHCAICNGDTGVSLETSLGSDEVSPETSGARQQLSSLQFWTPRLECPTLEVSSDWSIAQ